MLISRHRDGEFIARVVRYFGLGAVRGSYRKGVRLLREGDPRRAQARDGHSHNAGRAEGAPLPGQTGHNRAREAHPEAHSAGHLRREQEKALRLLGPLRAPLPFFAESFSSGVIPFTWPATSGRDAMRASAAGDRGKARLPHRDGGPAWYVETDLQPPRPCRPALLSSSSPSRRRRSGRNFLERLFPRPGDGRPRDAIWIHAASVGEAVIAENLISYLRPTVKNTFLITTNTYYTRDLLRKKFAGSVDVFSLPFDLPFSLDRFIGRSTFAALLLVETEIWPNLIWIAKARGIPVVIVNGRISDAHLGRYRRLSFFLERRSRLRGPRACPVGGAGPEVRLPRHAPVKGRQHGEPQVLPGGGRPPGRRPEGAISSTFGSIGKKSFPSSSPSYRRSAGEFPRLRIFVAPRELTLIAAIERQLPGGLRRDALFDRLQGGPPRRRPDGDGSCSSIRWATSSSIYARSLVAFVGGSLAPYGGQNLLEPLFVGTPVIFGPHVENFRADRARRSSTTARASWCEDGPEPPREDQARAARPDARQEPRRRRAGQCSTCRKGVMEKAAGLILETIWKNSPRLVELMETLGESGCPWDKKQTEQAFKTFLLEEVYELIEAIEDEDYRRSRKNWATSSSTSSSYRQICKEKGQFDIRDVVAGAYEKMYGRHPHVFFEGRRREAGRKEMGRDKEGGESGLFPRLPCAEDTARPSAGLRHLEEGGKGRIRLGKARGHP